MHNAVEGLSMSVVRAFPAKHLPLANYCIKSEHHNVESIIIQSQI